MSPKFAQRAVTYLLLAITACLMASRGFAVELTLWEQEREEDQKILDEISQEFQKSHPAISIRRSHYKTEDLRTQFQTSAMGGQGAALVYAPNDFGGPFSVMGIIQPVDGWVKKDRFFPSVLAAVTDAQHKTWGVPVVNGNHLMLFVNKKLAGKAPDTIEELIEIAKKTSDPSKNKYGLAYNLNEPFWFVAFMGAFGEHPLEGQTPKLDGDGMVKALELVRALKYDYKVVPPDCDYACADTLFGEGKVAMLINGDWSTKKYVDTFKNDLLIAPLPMSKATGKHMASMVSGKYLFFNKKLSGDTLSAAKAYAEFLTSTHVQEIFIARARMLPATLEAASLPALKNDKVLAASLKAMEFGQPMPMAPEMRAVWDAMRPNLQNVMAGRAQPKLAAQSMQKDVLIKIKEMKE